MSEPTTDDSRPESPLLRAGAEAVGRGELWEALRIFERAVEVEEGDLRLCALVDVAVVNDRLGDHVGAVERFREALGEMRTDAPRMYPGALIGLSQALQNLGDLEGAQKALERARTALGGADAPGICGWRVWCRRRRWRCIGSSGGGRWIWPVNPWTPHGDSVRSRPGIR